MKNFSPALQKKLDELKNRRQSLFLGKVFVASPFIQAPMSGIGSFPFRLLMEDLGAGATISELISCHGIHYTNKKTQDMLSIHPLEKNIGIQLFGEEAKVMASAAVIAQEKGAKFVDINMGCPVRKVVGKGAGSALLKDPSILPDFFTTIRKAITIPLTIKIRTGWDHDHLNSHEIVKIAVDCGIEFVSIHGRTRSQAYEGQANWDYIEDVAKNASLPIIGNGDLHTAFQVKNRFAKTHCKALMIARGSIRNPFIFSEVYMQEGETPFTPAHYLEALERLLYYTELRYGERPSMVLTQIKKFSAWFAFGYFASAKFREELFSFTDLPSAWSYIKDYFTGLEENIDPLKRLKNIKDRASFMAGGHG
ncbi:MAG: tRNA-dihydrouridine synthase [Bacteriovoracaceae bacterium]|nr:tRNA-dihydrouridine synthase [Bacteriovoracaceae bacterium]